MAANTKKTIKLEDVRAEQLKKAIKEIEGISDPYQKTDLRLKLVQVITEMGQTTVEDIPEGREALESNSKKKTNKKAETTVEKAKEAAKKASEKYEEAPKAEETVVEEQPEEVVEEQAPVATEVDQEVNPTVQEQVLITLEGEDGPMECDVTDAYVRLSEVPDDENKKLIAYYLMAYDADSIAAITNAFSSEITSDPYELLNADNYVAYLEYFNACLQA